MNQLLTRETVNPGLIKADYAVRGPLTDYASKIEKEIASKKHTHPFDRIWYINTGNPQATWQKPVTFPREVMALLSAPHLVHHPKVTELFPVDAIERAKQMLDSMQLGTGAYTPSPGYEFVRRNIASFIEKRDNANAGGKDLGPVDPDNIIMTEGASRGVQFVLQALISGPKDGVMIPVPQYPLYQATITERSGTSVPYYLREDEGWAVTADDLTKAYQSAVESGVNVKALVVINPGNPTGQVMDRSVLVEFVKFCEAHKLLLLADEVYQDNVYAEGKRFNSIREVL